MVIELQTPFLLFWRNLNKIAASYGLAEHTYGEAIEIYRLTKTV